MAVQISVPMASGALPAPVPLSLFPALNRSAINRVLACYFVYGKPGWTPVGALPAGKDSR
jgi:hypothetical protein